MRFRLDPEASLAVVGWLYTAAGVWAAIEVTVGFFAPLNQPLFKLYLFIPEANLAVLLLPLGIGLLWRSPLCRLIALVLSWLSVVTLAIVGILFATISVIGGNLQLLELQTMSTGDAISRAASGLLIGIPLFIWQLRVLSSEAVKRLTGKQSQQGSGAS